MMTVPAVYSRRTEIPSAALSSVRRECCLLIVLDNSSCPACSAPPLITFCACGYTTAIQCLSLFTPVSHFFRPVTGKGGAGGDDAGGSGRMCALVSALHDKRLLILLTTDIQPSDGVKQRQWAALPSARVL